MADDQVSESGPQLEQGPRVMACSTPARVSSHVGVRVERFEFGVQRRAPGV